LPFDRVALLDRNSSIPYYFCTLSEGNALDGRPRVQDEYRQIFQEAFGDLVQDDSAFQLFRSIHRASGILNAATDDHLRPHNLTSAKFRLLMWLLACKRTDYEEGMLPSRLSRMHDSSPNTISALLNGLEEQGLIERHKHPKDHRKSIILISDTGIDLVEAIHRGYTEFVMSTMQGLSEEERQILVTLLNKMSVSILTVLRESNSPCAR
jgi:DNA-binding MarR family transcriptional regulator